MRNKTNFLLLLGLLGTAFLFSQWFFSAQAAEWTKPDLVLVPAGSFQMGSQAFSNAQPVHQVTISKDFYMGKFEVTNQEYADMLNYALEKGYLDQEALSDKAKRREARGNSRSPQKYQDVFDEHSQITFADGKFKPHAGKENFPAVEVTWYGAAFYCNMLSEKEGLSPLYDLDDWSAQVYGKSGYRLPTEAEWEYAASYDDGRPYPWGKDEPSDSLANAKHTVKNPVDVDTLPVGSKSPQGDSKLGIADLAGNVSEWCNDWYNDSYAAQDTVDPVGADQVLYFNLPVFKKFSSARALRGGSFLLDPAYRKEMGRPFIMDTVVHPEVYSNTFRSYDFLSRQVIGFRIIKTTATEAVKGVFSKPERL
jgi:formylglycine-generating enzyme required for sulfatase activity